MKMKKLVQFLFAGSLLFVMNSCKKEEKNQPPPYNAANELYGKIGEPWEGGILAYVLYPGDPGFDANAAHGIIAAPADQSPSAGIQWDSTFTLTNATENAIGAGNANTLEIIDSVGSGTYAAKICYDLILNGYTDWCLPSTYELAKLYTNRDKIGGFEYSGQYWASTECPGPDNDTIAMARDFMTGNQSYQPKSMPYHVRAIRYF
jgi:hypothetical protein